MLELWFIFGIYWEGESDIKLFRSKESSGSVVTRENAYLTALDIPIEIS